MSLRALLLVTTLGLFVASCATPTPAPPAVLEYGRTDCTSSPDMAGATALTPPHERAEFSVTTAVTDQTACVAEGGGSAPYVVFSLPAEFADKTITVGSQVEAARIFAATAVLLDASGAVTRTLGRDQFVYRGGVYSAQFRPHEGEAFLLVKADPVLVGEAHDTINIGTGSTAVCGIGGCFNWQYGTEARQASVFSFTGTVSVTVFDSSVGARP